MLKVNPAVGELTVMVPVATVQVGCAVTVAMGALGPSGGTFIITMEEDLVHPLLFIAVTV